MMSAQCTLEPPEVVGLRTVRCNGACYNTGLLALLVGEQLRKSEDVALLVGRGGNLQG